MREWGGAALTFMENLNQLSISPQNIDYIILNHLEPDHTGFTYMLNNLAPNAQFVTTSKGVELLEEFYGIKDSSISVKTGDSLDLGNGKKFSFTEIPHVHWPETMVSYEEKSKILFSGDAFGAFGVHQGPIFDNETPNVSKEYWEEEMLRYYANIIAMFSPNVIKAIDSLKNLEIQQIAPSHGLIWKGKPEVVIRKYKRYANYNQDYAEPEICVVWGSMYGNTEKMLNAILRGISQEGLPVSVFRVPNDDPSYILAKAYKSAGLIIGTPTYEYSMFPPMKYFMELLQKKHIYYKKVLFFGSYGWSGGAQKDFEKLSQNMKWDIFEPLSFKGHPTKEQLQKGISLAIELAQQVKKIPPKVNDETY
ncbi:MAG: FprA family A-type flavoprotein [Candidatus Lokiarchaeota archaeon]|nr:FprA family A-type flavoprotein [Candidatus Lokiarchaeota archaeon]